MPLPEHDNPVWNRIAADISHITDAAFTIQSISPISGGCINSAARIDNGKQQYFVKFNAAEQLDMFEAEADGLRALVASKTLRVPLPISSGAHGQTAWLVLEYLALLGSASREAWRNFGTSLARMHCTHQDSCGWLRNNTIGATPQINTRTGDWIEFLRCNRIGVQLELAKRNGYGGSIQVNGEALLTQLDYFFDHYAPVASLLHGDLWSGNTGFLKNGDPIIFDPATYFGDRETDIAMTELFGGFDPAFYDAYNTEWPLDIGYETRKHVYNLYHLLNHLNLFGHSYLSRCEATIAHLLAAIP